MTLRTTSTPYDPQTLTEWRDTIARWNGLTYANMTSDDQAELNRLIDDAHEYISQRFGHQPWTSRTWAVTTVASVATFSLAIDVRQVEIITEKVDGETRAAAPTTKAEYLAAWRGGAKTHPWNVQEVPRYFFDGMTSDNPPQQQWRRSPTSTKVLTLEVYGRPYFGLLANGSYTELPANAVSALREHTRYKWKLYKQDYAAANAHRQAREDDLHAAEISDNPEGAVEANRIRGMPDDFYSEMEGP